MPDLPSPKDATESALHAECWDAVLSYADLCTAGSFAARELAEEAFALGVREIRAAEAAASRGRRTPRLPAIPLMLTAVRTTAASWEADGLGHRLDPDLRLWLNSDKAARYTGPPLRRPIALRGLRDLQEPDAALLWLTEVEALPSTVVARRLGLDPALVSEELDQVRTLFRDRCHRNHLDTPLDEECRKYARLLDAVTRSTPVSETPEDLTRHLATCVDCAEAAGCLRLNGGELPAALAGGVIGWGGLAYLERRRRAAEARLGTRRSEPASTGYGEPAGNATRARIVRGSLLAAAVALSGLALVVSMMPFGGSADDTARGDVDALPIADSGLSLPATGPSSSASASPSTAGSASASASASASGTPSTTGTETRADRKNPGPQGAPTATAGEAGGTGETRESATPGPDRSTPALCQVRYRLTDQWQNGFQAVVTVTTVRALDTWQVSWSFRDGQRITRIWDADVVRKGPRVTVAAADYNRSVAAGGTLSFGFIGTWQDRNTAPHGFTLNGHDCAIT